MAKAKRKTETVAATTAVTETAPETTRPTDADLDAKAAEILAAGKIEYVTLQKQAAEIALALDNVEQKGAVFSDGVYTFIVLNETHKALSLTIEDLEGTFFMSDSSIRNYRNLGMVRATLADMELYTCTSSEAAKKLCGSILDPETGKNAQVPAHVGIEEFTTRLKEWAAFVDGGMGQLEAAKRVRGEVDEDGNPAPKKTLEEQFKDASAQFVKRLGAAVKSEDVSQDVIFDEITRINTALKDAYDSMGVPG